MSDLASLPSKAPKLKTSTWFPLLLGFLVFFLLFGGVGYWMVQARLSGAVIASGVVSVQGKPKTIQHLDGGIVTEIPVENGDLVEEGALILRLDDTVLMSNMEIYENRLHEALSKRDRLISENSKLSSLEFSNKEIDELEFNASVSARDGQKELFRARRKRRYGQLSQLEEKIEQFRSQRQGVTGSLASKHEQSDLLATEYENLSSLAEQGFAAGNRVLALQRQVSELKGQIGEQQAELSRIDNLITETRIQMMQVDREFSENVLAELRDVESQVNDLMQQIKATKEQLSRVKVLAPVSGSIHELSIFTIGGIISPGAPIMQIIPRDEAMEFEVNVEPVFIDQVQMDQSASVVFSAFNSRTTPSLKGKVSGISANSIVNEEAGTSFYKIKIAVSDEELKRLGELKLVPGMPVEVFMTTDDRSPLDYFTRPLTDNFKRSMREE